MEPPIIAALIAVTGALMTTWLTHRFTMSREKAGKVARDPKQRSRQASPRFVDRISHDSKDFFSGGSALSTIGCAGTLELVWTFLARQWPLLASPLWGLAFSYIIILIYALVVPEPLDYPDAGKPVLTKEEMLSGVLNGFIVFVLVTGIRHLAF